MTDALRAKIVAHPLIACAISALIGLMLGAMI